MVRLARDVELNFELCCGEPDYSDEDLRLLDDLDRWERQNPAQLQKRQCGKSVRGIKGLQAATKPEYQAEVKAIFAPLAMTPERVMRKAERELYYLMPRQAPTAQMMAYQRWRRVYLEKMTLPRPEHFSRKALEDLLKSFPMVHNLVELTMLFGFADRLPKRLRNPKRERQLMEIGFWDANEYHQVCADHEDLLIAVEVAKYQYSIELGRCKRDLEYAQFRVKRLDADNKLLVQYNQQWQRKCQALEADLKRAEQHNQQWQQKCQAVEEKLTSRQEKKKSWLRRLYDWLMGPIGG